MAGLNSESIRNLKRLIKYYYGDIPEDKAGGGQASNSSQAKNDWPLWEVFIRNKQGLDHKHAGSLHAADAKMAGHLYRFGSDKLGRDILSRILYGTRVSIFVALMGAGISFVLGVSYGLVAGFSSPAVDNAMMRIVDVLYAYPTLILIILLQVFLTAIGQQSPEKSNAWQRLVITLDQGSGGLFFVFLAIGAVNWLNMARLTRGQVLHYRQQEFVQAAQVVGASRAAIMWRHLLPNIIGPCIVAETLAIPSYIYTEAFLSFIGLGVQPPIPSWGSMISDGYGALRSAPHVILFPALALSLTMLAFNFLGDALRDAMDPKLRNR